MILGELDSRVRVKRVCSWPTYKKPGAGIAGRELAFCDDLDTLTIIPYSSSDGELIEINSIGSSTRVTINFENPTLPKERVGFRYYYLLCKRICVILGFHTVYLIKYAFKPVDIVHIHSPMFVLILLWGKLRKAKTVITLHGTDYYRLRGSNVLKKLISVSDSILCVSQEQYEAVCSWYPGKLIRLISNGIDNDFFKATERQRKKNILAIGSLRWHKAFDILIKAFAIIAEQHPQWNLVIAGEGADRKMLEKLIGNLNLSNRIVLKGALSREEIKNELISTEIFVLSSVTEGLPKVLLEAMSSGCACIATDVGDCKNVLHDSGLIVNPSDENALSKAISTYITNDRLRDRMSKKSREISLNYSWDKYRKNHLDIYSSLLDMYKK